MVRSALSSTDTPVRLLLVALAAALTATLMAGMTLARPISTADAVAATQNYVVVLSGTDGADGSFEVAGSDALNLAAARSLVAAADGVITSDLSAQIGVLLVSSSNAAFADTLRASALVEAVGTDWAWKQYPTFDEATASGEVTLFDGGPEQTADTLEPLQWSMMQIRAPQAHDVQAGWGAVDVGILDTGIDGRHPDFIDEAAGSNVDCARGRNSITFVIGGGPGVGVEDPCTDNGFHGTHVAGIVAARANHIGVVGVAPNVTLVPVKVCDTTGHCYAGAVVDGITYAGDQQLDVINMSFFVDDNETLQSTEFKCQDDETQRAFRRAVERAVQYARNRGVTPVAALGNSDTDLAHPEQSDPTVDGNNCDVVPAETSGVIGTAALGRQSQKATYSNWGTGATDIAAPGGQGTGNCLNAVLSTFPVALGGYACISGTSMASPHAAGVSALIISQLGTLGADGDVKASPTKVESVLQGTAVDIGLAGYDECFGNGRIDALRAVLHDTSAIYDPTAPLCPEYEE